MKVSLPLPTLCRRLVEGCLDVHKELQVLAMGADACFSKPDEFER